MDRDVTLNVDELVSKFKKEGHFDRLRKQILETVNEKESGPLLDRLKKIIDEEMVKDRTLKSKDQFRAAPLIAGAVDRSSLYEDSMEHIRSNVLSDQDLREVIYNSLEQIGIEQIEHEDEEKLLNSKTMDGRK
ncbi:Set1 complex component shg1 [Schizosaccharomyces pombe]|uniref:Set1 complex component shg1 n=1 Tax=Schizosaccharomyces pombe (strain 972 / ATCC 24843) TaxID=284812 RepID=SHG1_SCHPO|nr:Set1C complex subunit Shg1 [Schizosaccharomyces pombe]Q10321.3 RecName: Full=Set1 complex component shg1; Short=Set1C component shg1; AltName: Full=COMPASS component shg1; AltName: Full=Complex proteins associated with set1 protein shg1 [Schizosaccharomyces pombe 972h-]CAD99132.2 Set1C complex subunit Shg1 [Schizosaccharomyces pombe]|eukprot:NP_001018248.2 Set1C complex subunit Shg1 [Schizosaccharomyces pombe]